ncbi:hypothetical protein [Streptacidiphilus sp. P02-A3a]|uniref:hypothetical protein n=1 Tax=Streptacidiphilus sp. P02-A3a TaxID=2704468 RepID=UPI0015FB7429|nr:hypothetical protein [Streptacidiphilus sp. P02-A3a]QMU70115.1 hypothetical protein GXP74_19655 [Streptacidiphilus sp. P02-A3a]QMU70432.1 hypothetical protein GXP74_21705 [Streptacidiphilus sp. P02-A3a]
MPQRITAPTALLVLGAVVGATATGCGATAAARPGTAPPTTTTTAATATASAAAAGGGRAGGGGWTLSAPGSAAGLARFQPPAAESAKLTQSLDRTAQELGLTGSTVEAVYADPAQGGYLVFAGLNGSGYTPSVLGRMAQVPATRQDGTGDRITQDWQPTSAGDHGGQAGCQETMVQSGSLAVLSSACLWLTATTFGLVTYYPDTGSDDFLTNTPAGVVAPLMRQVRDAVERPAGP